MRNDSVKRERVLMSTVSGRPSPEEGVVLIWDSIVPICL